MKNKLKKILEKNRKLFMVVKSIRFLQFSSLTKITGGKKKYPKVIQLPITYHCNSKCVMCNVWQMDYSGEAKIQEFASFMKDDIFKEVEAVGINGGEPSLIKNLDEYAAEILKLPSLKALNIISHGFNTKLILSKVEQIYKLCKAKQIKFHISISLDGVGDIHNQVRGKEVFHKTTATIDEIKKNQHKYCDSFNMGCTVINKNVDNLVELNTYANRKDYDIKYRLGIENKRIESDQLTDQYSVLYSPLKQSAKEFFHLQMVQASDIMNKFKYYGIFHWLNNEKPKRMLGCAWKDEGVTLDSRGELYYCAVASDSIGTLREKKGTDIFFDDKNIEYRKSIIDNSCDGCIHDYVGKSEMKDSLKFLFDTIRNRYAMKVYKFKIKFV